jgi:hypothetical protein
MQETLAVFLGPHGVTRYKFNFASPQGSGKVAISSYNSQLYWRCKYSYFSSYKILCSTAAAAYARAAYIKHDNQAAAAVSAARA